MIEKVPECFVHKRLGAFLYTQASLQRILSFPIISPMGVVLDCTFN